MKYTDKQVYNQLRYYSYLFDAEKAKKAAAGSTTSGTPYMSTFRHVKIGAFPRCCSCGCIQKFEWPEEALELRRQTYQHVRPSLGWFKGLILSREIMSNIWLCYIVASFSSKQVLYSIQCRCSPILTWSPLWANTSKTIQRCYKYFHFLLLRPLPSVLQR